MPSAATSAAGLAGGSETDTSACAAASRPWSDGTLNVARAGATDPVGGESGRMAARSDEDA